MQYTFQVTVDYRPDADTLAAIHSDAIRRRDGSAVSLLRENARALTLQAINASEHPALTLVPDTLGAEASDAIQHGDPAGSDGQSLDRDTHYDYECQAFVTNGRYVRCGHPETTDCQCYGRLHEGEAEIISKQ